MNRRNLDWKNISIFILRPLFPGMFPIFSTVFVAMKLVIFCSHCEKERHPIFFSLRPAGEGYAEMAQTTQTTQPQRKEDTIKKLLPCRSNGSNNNGGWSCPCLSKTNEKQSRWVQSSYTMRLTNGLQSTKLLLLLKFGLLDWIWICGWRTTEDGDKNDNDTNA